jgi:hypothetical protein
MANLVQLRGHQPTAEAGGTKAAWLTQRRRWKVADDQKPRGAGVLTSLAAEGVRIRSPDQR